MDCTYFGQKQCFVKQNKVFMMNLFLTNTQLFTFYKQLLDVLWIIVMFLSAVLTHSDGTHSGSIGEQVM